jgi:hypothetical protein
MLNASNFAKKIFSPDNILCFEPVNSFKKKHKIVVFVPPEKIDEITFAMAKAGAGKIGHYNICSFRTVGTGTFKGSKATNPAIGLKGIFEKVDEIRLEMVCDSGLLDKVIYKMLNLHPYEEPAYEIYDIMMGERIKPENAVRVILKKRVRLQEVVRKLNEKINEAVVPVRLLSKKFKSAVIDLTGNELNYSINENNPGHVLSIKLARPSGFNISFK